MKKSDSTKQQHSSPRSSALRGAILAVALVAAAVGTYEMGISMSDVFSTTMATSCVGVVLGALSLWGIQLYRNSSADRAIISERRNKRLELVEKYNRRMRQVKTSSQCFSLQSSFNADKWSQNQEFKAEGKPHLTKVWQKIICTGFILLCLDGCFSMGLSYEPPTAEEQLFALMDNRSWNADNIPMPHMADHTLYVSNPDSILSPEVVDSINATLLALDDELGIESVMAIVGHIDGDDPVAMVRGIYKKYGVGRNDRGLVVVVGYLDHSYFIAPGRSLEGDLTDLECNHLAQNYLIPSMRAEQPDSGMLYLARGIHALMSEKDMPQMATLTTASTDGDIDLSFFYIITLTFIWSIFSFVMAKMTGIILPMVGPDISLSQIPFDNFGGGSSGTRGGFSGGGGGFSGGGFGGGSWGGGGSGGRW